MNRSDLLSQYERFKAELAGREEQIVNITNESDTLLTERRKKCGDIGVYPLNMLIYHSLEYVIMAKQLCVVADRLIAEHVPSEEG
jgi:hypothetical protein